MNRLAWIGSLACLIVASTGCRMAGGCAGGGCHSGPHHQGVHDFGGCPDGGCHTPPTGVLGKLKAAGGGCGQGSCGQGILGCLGGWCGLGKHSGGSCGHPHGGGDGSCGPACGPGGCGSGGCRNGCVAGPLGWQQGGHDYSSHLQAGLLGHRAPAALNNRPFTPGPPSAQVGYPYYSHHGPRDFLLDDPPTIGR